MKRAALIALLVCSCHAYDQSYRDCMSSGHCVDSVADAGDAGAESPDGGLFFDDTSTIELGTLTIGQRSGTVARHLINPLSRSVAYSLLYDPQIEIDFFGVDGGTACDATGITVGVVCRWEIALVPQTSGQFNGSIDLFSDAGHLQLNVTAVGH